MVIVVVIRTILFIPSPWNTIYPPPPAVPPAYDASSAVGGQPLAGWWQDQFHATVLGGPTPRGGARVSRGALGPRRSVGESFPSAAGPYPTARCPDPQMSTDLYDYMICSGPLSSTGSRSTVPSLTGEVDVGESDEGTVPAQRLGMIHRWIHNTPAITGERFRVSTFQFTCTCPWNEHSYSWVSHIQATSHVESDAVRVDPSFFPAARGGAGSCGAPRAFPP